MQVGAPEYTRQGVTNGRMHGKYTDSLIYKQSKRLGGDYNSLAFPFSGSLASGTSGIRVLTRAGYAAAEGLLCLTVFLIVCIR